jgi:drug/metabolite transporter (DMT)-like permease
VRAYDVSVLRADVLGIAFGLASSVFFVVYFVLVRRLRGHYASWTLTACGDGVGALVLSPVVAVSFAEVVAFPWQVWLLVLVIAWFPSLLAYLLYSHAIKYVKAKGSVLSVMEPLSAAVLSTVFVGERFEAWQVLGIALALAGVVLLFRRGMR